jgi:hypothetical protein
VVYRTPMHSGSPIIKAFIGEGLTAFDEVTAYLVSYGIKMS